MARGARGAGAGAGAAAGSAYIQPGQSIGSVFVRSAPLRSVRMLVVALTCYSNMSRTERKRITSVFAVVLQARRQGGTCRVRCAPGLEARALQQGSVVGIWSVAIWSLVRVFGAATESRQLSFAGPRPSSRQLSFAPQTDMVATTRQICRSPLVLSVGHAEWRKHPSVIGFPLPEDHGLWEKGRSLAAGGNAR